ncbi:MAG: glycosyltransferase [Legionella sp.]|uniref:glycosyltransferase n=1 Tax=Legionella sp. TaxID=459 RepID=UPI0039E4F747
MNELFSKKKYYLNATTQVWSRAEFSSISYNDGDTIENGLAAVIAQAQDISVLSSELQQHCVDWPSTYHLSAQRSNLLRPLQSMLDGADVLEIGSGCGAITRYLGECGANVLALEGTLRRAEITRSRTRDLNNVTVIAERFDLFNWEQKFDVITLIGVLEYAKVFMPGTSPVQNMLQRVKSMLKPQGKLIIAIENQLGLKYFSGAPEDHLGQVMYGIEGHYSDKQPTTYGRAVLIKYLEQAGFSDSQFFAPFPDYKLPCSIISEKGFSCPDFDAGTLAAQSVRHDPQLPPYLAFSPELVWPSIAENQIALDLANSFLIVAQSTAEKLPAADTLAYHYATQRAPAFCKETLFVPNDSGAIEIKYNLLDHQAHCTTTLDGVSLHIASIPPYIYGKPLAREFVKIITREGWGFDEVGAFFKRYLAIVALLIAKNEPYTPINALDTLLPGDCIDLVPQNIILDTQGVAHVIDTEWHWADQISAGYLIFRSLLGLTSMVSRFGRPANTFTNTWMGFFLAVYNTLGFELNEKQMLNYLLMEDLFQSKVRQYPFNLLRRISKLNIPICTVNLNSLAGEQTNKIVHLESTLSAIESKLSTTESKLSETKSKLSEQIHVLSQQVHDMTQTIADLKSSSSWRVTKPMRNVGALVNKALIAKQIIVSVVQQHGYRKSATKALFFFKTGGLSNIVSQLRKQRIVHYEFARINQNARASLQYQQKNIQYAPSTGYHLVTAPQEYCYIPPAKPGNAQAVIDSFNEPPLFSIVVPTYNTPLYFLDELVESIQNQWYPYWELILADDCSVDPALQEALSKLTDTKIKVIHLEKNSGISGATNTAIEASQGNFIVFLDHDDVLTADCLYELALCIERDKPDFIYSDEDKLTEDYYYTQPHFKPDWSPDTMMSTMFTGHVSCVRKSLLEKTGLLRSEYDGCQDWDFVLRVAEHTKQISHIPKVLYHWRITPASVAADISAKPYVLEASQKVRLEALKRRKLEGSLEATKAYPGYFRINYHLTSSPLISIIIPTKNNLPILRRCICSIEEKTKYKNYELIIIDNGSIETNNFAYLNELNQKEYISIIRHDALFNFSELNNLGVKASKGEIILFLNDDTEVIGNDWLERMAAYASLPHVGAVGAKLLYPNTKQTQHAGVLNLSTGPVHAFLHYVPDHPGYFMRNSLEYNWIAVTGACLMIEKKKFLEIGEFDEEFPIAYNDVDLCFRCIDAGYYNVVCQATTLYHHESISRGSDLVNSGKLKRLHQEMDKLYDKHPKYYQFDPFFNVNLHPNGCNFELPMQRI